MFSFSQEERKAIVKRISAWVEQLTSADTVLKLRGKQPEDCVYVRLDTGAIHGLAPDRLPPAHPGLKVVWEPPMSVDGDGKTVPDTRPGANGHVGIANLDIGTDTERTTLRAILADLAGQLHFFDAGVVPSSGPA
jgi:hypothetical protein